MRLRIQILLLFNFLIGTLIYGQNGEELISNYNFQHHGLSEGKRPSCLTEYQLQSKANKVDGSNDSITTRKNGAFVEIGGAGGIYSLGYIRRFNVKKNYELIGSVGFSTNFTFQKPYFAFGFPISITNRFKFWKFNGVDIGLSFSELLNVWTIRNKEEYYVPNTFNNVPFLLISSIYLGWSFNFNNFSISPRFSYLEFWDAQNRFSYLPFFAINASYFFN